MAQRRAEETVQRCAEIDLQGLQTSQLTSGKPWPRTGRPGGQLYARAQSTLREADYRAWMIRDQQGRTECQTLALLYLVSSASRSALPLSGSKLICANTSTDASIFVFEGLLLLLKEACCCRKHMTSNEVIYLEECGHFDFCQGIS